jgi:ribosome maturation factor RimP
MREERQQALAEVERIAGEVAAEIGVEIVEFVFHSQGRHSLLRIDIDRPGMPGVALADCEALSRALGDRIESLSFFEAPYDLQVSSPGLDRPIRTDDDIRRNTGRPVRVEFRDENGKVRELHGTLAGPRGSDSIAIDADEDVALVPRDRILLLKQDVTPAGRKRKGP